MDWPNGSTVPAGRSSIWRTSPTASWHPGGSRKRPRTAASDIKTADLLVIATPTYKASFTGLLKLLLDVLPAGSLASTVLVPLTVAGGPAHRYLADLQLRPVLSELGAVVPAPTLLLEEPELPELADLAASYLARHGTVTAAAVGALAGSRQPA